ncbi:MAG: hypothetical protein HN704_10865 [Bacteroidetes bacterium]|nr:hypothetical protein [Bacteroidota bacterium]MBT6687178.1 hypothetical protein [Bacteroidota bacterium]MBT7492093.1 hypothetical protein [Bacteroidota bacterium]
MKLDTNIKFNDAVISCKNLTTKSDFEKAGVKHDFIRKKLKEVFGKDECYLIIAAANNAGLRPDTSSPRKLNVSDEIDKVCDGFFGGEQNINYYLNVERYETEEKAKPKPVISACDAHSFNDIDNYLGKKVVKKNKQTNKDETIKNITWIKADPTFEGLKQITYEPELRVGFSIDNPEKKSNYQVIDKLEINYHDIYNKSIELNSYLNSIIGGRSTGKSILLASIAKKLKTDAPITFEDKKGYDNYIDEISELLKIIWKDGVENNEREIEYFHQGYMYDIARDEYEKDKLIQKILKNKGKERILYNYDKSISENRKKISNLVNDYFQLHDEISEKKLQASDKGDKKGIEDEIKRLSTELNKLTTIKIIDEEKKKYYLLKDKIDKANQQKANLQEDNKIIDSLIEINLFKESISYDITSVSETNKNVIETIFKSLKEEFTTKWKSEINHQKTLIGKNLLQIQSELETTLKDTTYIKVSKAFNESAQFSELDDKISKEKKKLHEITSILSEIEELEKQNASNKKSLKLSFNDFFVKSEEIISKLSDSVDDLRIKSKLIEQSNRCLSFLKSSLNQNSKNNQIYLSGAYVIMGKPSLSEFVFQIFEDLISNKLKLKGEFDNRKFSNNLLSENYYKISYDLIYDGDNFEQMSEGKKAFVILKLLLDFSNKECPILIDQPEDDLDNRAIYTELAKYLRKMKIERQIILVTHNPNIVVGADSELVIVANQQGIKNKNTDENKKFQYVTGSIENTRIKDDEIKSILDSQGIREHVCDILEGGTTAFINRERKYAIK